MRAGEQGCGGAGVLGVYIEWVLAKEESLRMKFAFRVALLASLALLGMWAAGCNAGNAAPNAPIPQSTATDTPTATATIRASQTPFPTRTSLPPTFTQLPTLPPDQAEALVQELLETNAGCQLPCWWGITPGESHWNSTFQFLSTFASKIVFLGGGIAGIRDFEVDFRAPNSMTTSYIFISVENNIVEAINVQLGSDNEIYQFQLHQLLSDYGKPAEIYMYIRRPFSHPGEENFFPFRLVLHYPDQYIFAFYSFEGQLDNDTIYWCSPTKVVPEVFLWSANSSTNVSRVMRGYLHRKYVEDDSLPLPRMEDFTNMSIDEFYQTFADANSVACLETPESSWVGDARP